VFPQLTTNQSSGPNDIPANLDDFVNWCINRGLVHEIHTSERKSFRSCRRRWDWLYRNNYYPRVTAKPLEFGVAYHVGMETFYNPDTWLFDSEVKLQRAIQEFVNECERQKQSALANQNEVDLDYNAEEDYNERIELGRGMLEYYAKVVAPVEDNFTPVKVEIEFMVPIPNVETGQPYIFCKCNECKEKWCSFLDDRAAAKSHQLNAQREPGTFGQVTMQPAQFLLTLKDSDWMGLPVCYGGRLDCLVKDKWNNYWIVDWKTASAISSDKEFLDLDDQIGTYVWALRKLGIDIKGFIYHEQLKNFPQPPKENKRLSGGRRFSVDKNQPTTFDIYLAHVARYDTEAWGAGAYDEFLNFLREEGKKFYDRREVHKSPEAVANLEYNLSLEALDMLDPNLRVYPQSGRFSCGFCAYRFPCIEKNNGGDYLYTLNSLYERKIHYYKEKRLSTETQGGE